VVSCLPGRSAETGALPLEPSPLFTLMSGPTPSFSAPFAPGRSAQRTLWDGSGVLSLETGCQREIALPVARGHRVYGAEGERHPHQHKRAPCRAAFARSAELAREAPLDLTLSPRSARIASCSRSKGAALDPSVRLPRSIGSKATHAIIGSFNQKMASAAISVRRSRWAQDPGWRPAVSWGGRTFRNIARRSRS
jgi:hypothetical protein